MMYFAVGVLCGVAVTVAAYHFAAVLRFKDRIEALELEVAAVKQFALSKLK